VYCMVCCTGCTAWSVAPGVLHGLLHRVYCMACCTGCTTWSAALGVLHGLLHQVYCMVCCTGCTAWSVAPGVLHDLLYRVYCMVCCTGSLLWGRGVKRSGGGIAKSPHLALRLKNEYSYISTPFYACLACWGQPLPLLCTTRYISSVRMFYISLPQWSV